MHDSNNRNKIDAAKEKVLELNRIVAELETDFPGRHFTLAIYEVYNGPGELPWETARIDNNHNYRHIRVNKLMELDATVRDSDRITAEKSIEKMRKEYKNPKKRR